MGRTTSPEPSRDPESDTAASRDPRAPVGRSRLNGLAALLVGASQLPLAFDLAGPSASPAFFVVGSGGWLLIGVGTNLLRGRDAFDAEGAGTAAWLSTTVMVVLAVAVVVAVPFAVLSP